MSLKILPDFGAMSEKVLDVSGRKALDRHAPDFLVGSQKQGLALIAGPCLVESIDHAWMMANELASIAIEFDDRLDFCFKASYRKANRTSHESTDGAENTLSVRKLFERIIEEIGIPVMTDVHSVPDALWWGEIEGLIMQVPALLSRQTALIKAVARHGVIHIKKGQFMAPHDARHAVNKARYFNPNCHVIVSERGYTFGYNDLVFDPRSIPIMKATSGADEVLFDATHSVQRPSALGNVTGGQREFIEVLARAAIVSGADGLFCEVHDDPSVAFSDGPCQIPLKQFRDFLERMLDLYEWQQATPSSSFPLG